MIEAKKYNPGRVGIISTTITGVVLAVTGLAVFYTCNAIKVAYDYDTKADFKGYHTYAFATDLKKLPVNGRDRKYILDAICNELDLRGYDMAGTVDLLVDVQVKSKRGNKAVSFRRSDTGKSAPQYPVGVGFTSGEGHWGRFKDGALVINVVDNREGKLIWRGTGGNALERERLAEMREADINYAIAMIFRSYPVRR
jgi:hypothetical protein